MNEESSTTNLELNIARVSVFVLHAAIRFLTAKNMSVVKIQSQLTKVYGSDIMSVQMVRKWCQEVREGQHEVHNELCIGRPKMVTNESVNTICAQLNEDQIVV